MANNIKINKCLKLIVVFLIITSMIYSALAQEDQSKKNSVLEVGFGINSKGPKQQMAELMVKYGFDKDTHPHYNKMGLSFLISYSHSISPRSKMGILLNCLRLGAISGYSYTGGHLSIHFSSISLVPLYSFDLENFEFRAGPAIMINSAEKTRGSSDPEKYTMFSVGLLTELDVKFLDTGYTFCKFGISYMFAKGNEMGSYTAMLCRPFYSTCSYATIPESKINFSCLNIFFGIEIRLENLMNY